MEDAQTNHGERSVVPIVENVRSRARALYSLDPDAEIAFTGGGSPLWFCGGGRWSCGIDGSKCGTTNFSIAKYTMVLRDFELKSAITAANFQLPASTVVLSSSASAPIVTSAESSNARAAATNIPASTGPPICESTETTFKAKDMVGVGVGVGLPLLLALAGLVFLLWREKKKSQTPSSAPPVDAVPTYNAVPRSTEKPLPTPISAPVYRRELDLNQQAERSELYDHRHELEIGETR